jgi:hypothetical protein
MFPSLGLCQHVGVLLFAASRNVVKCRYLVAMAAVQVVNFVIWGTQAMMHWMPLWSQFPFIFLVGSIGGLSYVNTYDMVLNDETLDQKRRELGANFTEWSVIVSVLVSSAFCLLAEKTFLKPFVPE